MLSGVSPQQEPCCDTEGSALSSLAELVPEERCQDQSVGIHLHQQAPLEMTHRVTHQCRELLGALA